MISGQSKTASGISCRPFWLCVMLIETVPAAQHNRPIWVHTNREPTQFLGQFEAGQLGQDIMHSSPSWLRHVSCGQLMALVGHIAVLQHAQLLSPQNKSAVQLSVKNILMFHMYTVILCLQ